MDNPNSIDPMAFRQALGSFTTGVTVVTTRSQEGEDVGLTANSFNSVSLDPPMVLWSLGKNAGSLPAFTAAENFAVHILAEDQENLSGQFAKKGVDKFAGLDLERGPNEIPLLKRAAARFVCRTAFKYEGGDHIIFVGEVIDFTHSDMPPLLFHSGQYAKLKKQVGPTDRSHQDNASDFGQDFLGYLLARSYQQLVAPLKAELAKRQINSPQYYLINLLSQFDNKTLQQLSDVIALGETALTVQDYEDLVARGLVETYTADGKELVRLTSEGQQISIELASMSKALEADAEKDLDYNQRQDLKLTLRQLIQTTDPGPPKSWS